MLPATMQAIAIREPGGPEVLALVTRAVPEPGQGEILIAVRAASVNRPDILQRMGRYALQPGASDLPGLDVAGTVAAVGPGVERFKEGDRVCALLAGGGYAEYCVAPEVQALPVPGGLDFTAAAALPETTFTVWANVFESGALVAGESFLVHGGTSGIGTTAIALASAFGARVFATAGSAAKCEACVRLGAERAVNYKDDDFVAALQQATGGRGVDVILDMVGGDYTARNLKLLAPRGRLVQIAYLRGARAEIDWSVIMAKGLTLGGSLLRPRSVAEKGRIAAAVLRHVWPLVESGAFVPVVHQALPLAHAREAHELMESGAHVGKIVLTIG